MILIDGIAGSGKSVLSQRLYRTLHLNKIPVTFYHEFHRPHPVLDIEAGSVSGWIEQSMVKWRRFIDHFSRRDSVAIMDGAFFQCGAAELLERDAGDQAIFDYIGTTAELIKTVNPVVIHLYQRDIEAALKKVYDRRPRAWVKRADTFLADTSYGRGRAISGFDLYLDFNKSLRRIADSLFGTFDMTKLAIDNTDYKWDACFDEICRFLGVQQLEDPFNPYDYCGDYVSAKKSRLCRLVLMEDALRVKGLFRIIKNLLPKQEDTVFVQTWPDELTFTRDRTGQIVSFHATGPWNRLGDDIWKRVGID